MNYQAASCNPVRGIMVLFGATDPNPRQTTDAVEAALAMRQAPKAYNEELKSSGGPELAIGIGIFSGTPVAGADILITQAVREQLDARFCLRGCAPMEVRAKSGKLLTFAVGGVGPRRPEGTPDAA